MREESSTSGSELHATYSMLSLRDDEHSLFGGRRSTGLGQLRIPRRPYAPATIATPMTATMSWTSSSSQSMPLVAVGTPRRRAMKVPTNAATIPTRIVSQIGIFCFPGRTRRASAPMIAPIMIGSDDSGDGHAFHSLLGAGPTGPAHWSGSDPSDGDATRAVLGGVGARASRVVLTSVTRPTELAEAPLGGSLRMR